MKKLTITIDTDEHAAQLEELLHKLNYVVSVEEHESNNNTTSDEESFVNERIEYYGKNKGHTLSFDEFTAELKSRYGI